MWSKRPNLKILKAPVVLTGLWIFFALLSPLKAETVVLHLKNGDRIAGTIISEDTNRVVISTTWIKELAIPVFEIKNREKPEPAAPAPKPAVPAPTPAPAPAQ